MKSANDDLESSRQSIASSAYASDLALAQAALEQGDAARTRLLLERYQNDDRRGFEWHYFNRLAGAAESPLQPEDEPMYISTVSPDGRLVAFAAWNSTIAVRDLGTLRFLWSRAADLYEVKQLAFSPDSRQLAAFGGKSPPHLFNAADGTPTGPSFEPCPNPVALPSGTWSPDGRWIAAASGESPICVWSTSDGRLAASLPALGIDDPYDGVPSILAMSFYKDERATELRIFARDQTYRTWAIPSGEDRGGGGGPPYQGRAAAFTLNGGRLFTIDQEGSGEVLDLNASGQSEGSQSIPPLAARPREIIRAAIAPDGHRLATGLTNGTIVVTNLYDDEILRLHGHEGTLESLAFHPDGRRILSSAYGGQVFLRDPNLARPWRTLETDGEIRDVAFTSDGRSLIAYVVTVQTDGDQGRFVGPAWVVRWDLASARPTRAWRSDVVGYWRLSPAGDRFARFSHKSHVYVLDKAQEHPRVLPVSLAPLGRAFAFDPMGRHLGFDNWPESREGEGLQFRVVDTETGALVDLDPLPIPPLRFDYAELAISPYGKQVAGFADRSPDVVIWDGTNGRIIRRLSLREQQGYCMKFDPTGRRLAVGCIQGQILVWDLKKDQPPLELKRSISSIRDLAFTPDGSRLAAVDTGEFVALWDLDAGQEVASFHEVEAGSVAFSPDGGFLAIVLLNGKIRLLDARPSSPDVVASREAASLLDFHLDPSAAVASYISGDDPLDSSACDRARAAIETDRTITEDVRRKALEMLEPAGCSYEVRRHMRAAIAIHDKGWDRMSRDEARAAALLDPSPLQEEILRQIGDGTMPSTQNPVLQNRN